MECRIAEAVRFSASRNGSENRWVGSQRFECWWLGAGPAGIAAAVRAAECGVRVGIVDDNADVRRADLARSGEEHERGGAMERTPAERSTSRSCIGNEFSHQPEAGVLLAEGTERCRELR